MAGEDRAVEQTPNAANDTCTHVERVVAFYLGGQRYALPIERVQEIQQIVAFSDVPGGGTGVVGMVNLRGNVIPAIDARRLVGLPEQEYVLETPMIISRVEDQLVALVVDEVQDVIELPEGCLQAAPGMHALSSKMMGVCRLSDGLVYLLDLDLMLGRSVPKLGG
jgi:purine-binding chemotaxis protein CheW